MLATCVFNTTSTCYLEDWRLIDAELDADTELNIGAELDSTERHAAPMEKTTGAVENATAGGWPGGEEGWRAAVLEHSRERGRWPVGRGRGHCVDVVMLERVWLS
jgi:hypothetical protein